MKRKDTQKKVWIARIAVVAVLIVYTFYANA